MESQNSIRPSVSEGPRRVQIVQVDQTVETDTAFQVRPFRVREAIPPGWRRFSDVLDVICKPRDAYLTDRAVTCAVDDLGGRFLHATDDQVLGAGTVRGLGFLSRSASAWISGCPCAGRMELQCVPARMSPT